MNILRIFLAAIHPRTIIILFASLGFALLLAFSAAAIASAHSAVNGEGGGGVTEVDGSYLELGLGDADKAEAEAIRKILNM